MHPEEFLEQQKERNEKKRRRTILACIVICAVWIPVALLIYKPPFLFERGGQSTAVDNG